MYSYFEIQAKIGITKHMGGLEATKKLLELFKVDKSDHVLVVGSGNGVSAIKIHEFTGCQVTGIDLSQDMWKEPVKNMPLELNLKWEMRRTLTSLLIASM